MIIITTGILMIIITIDVGVVWGLIKVTVPSSPSFNPAKILM
jgi:hypothetical protein